MRKVLVLIVVVLWNSSGGIGQDKPLQLTIKADKDVYADGEPIDLIAMLNNSGQSTARIYSPEYWGVSEIIVENSRGVRISPRGIKVERMHECASNAATGKSLRI
jgi:hypothetical protein